MSEKTETAKMYFTLRYFVCDFCDEDTRANDTDVTYSEGAGKKLISRPWVELPHGWSEISAVTSSGESQPGRIENVHACPGCFPTLRLKQRA